MDNPFSPDDPRYRLWIAMQDGQSVPGALATSDRSLYAPQQPIQGADLDASSIRALLDPSPMSGGTPPTMAQPLSGPIGALAAAMANPAGQPAPLANLAVPASPVAPLPPVRPATDTYPAATPPAPAPKPFTPDPTVAAKFAALQANGLPMGALSSAGADRPPIASSDAAELAASQRGDTAGVLAAINAQNAPAAGPLATVLAAGAPATDWDKGGADNANKFRQLMGHAVGNLGATPNGAAGMLGNAYAESNLRPGSYNPTGEDSHGLYQWNADVGRWQKYQQWATQNNKPMYDPFSQMEYAKVESQKMQMGDGSGRTVWDAVNAAKSPEEASDIWLKYFENPKVKDYANRQGFTQQAMAAYDPNYQITPPSGGVPGSAGNPVASNSDIPRGPLNNPGSPATGSTASTTPNASVTQGALAAAGGGDTANPLKALGGLAALGQQPASRPYQFNFQAEPDHEADLSLAAMLKRKSRLAQGAMSKSRWA